MDKNSSLQNTYGSAPMLASYNLLKIIAIFMVVAVHMLGVISVAPEENRAAGQIRTAVATLLLTSNGLFFMISGRFILAQQHENLWRFYWRRIVKIGLPVLFISVFYYINSRGLDFSSEYLMTFVKDLLQSHIAGYLWFVYALAGFYLAAPFLAKMFHQLNRQERIWLTILTASYFFIQNCYQIFHLEMALTSYPFYSWLFFCMLGYLLDSFELTNRQRRLLILTGILAFFISVWEQIYSPLENPAIYNYSLSMICICCGLYLAVTGCGRGFAKCFEKLINTVARYSFFVYLFHGFTQNMVIRSMPESLSGWGNWFFLSCLSFLLALLLSVPTYHLLYTPASHWLLKQF